MNAAVASIIRDKVAVLPWIDKIAGLVKPLTRLDLVTTSKGEKVQVRRTYPISCDITYVECGKEGVYKDLVPNSKNRSIVYFEDKGLRLLSHNSGYFNWSSQLQLIAWVNMDYFEFTGCYISPLLVQSIVNLVPVNPFNAPPFAKIRMSITGETEKSNRIFSQYTYQEEVRQYLMRPFDYFSLNIQTEFSTHESCAEAIVLKTPECAS